MPARIEPSLFGKMSERRVLRVLQANGPLSRAEVSRLTKLSAPAVSRAVAALLKARLLEESTEAEHTGGRPATRLRLATDAAQVLGVVLDADRCRVVSASLDGKLHDEGRSFVTPGTYAKLLDAVADHAGKLMDRDGVATLGVGVSIPGLIDYRTQCGVLSPNLPMTNGQTPGLDLARRLEVECILLHESHALCLGEQFHGQARDLADFAMLDIHTGVGLGVVCAGRQLTGHSGLAGEVGHMTVLPVGGRACGCGNSGCLETVASDSALAWRVSQQLGRSVDIDEVIALAGSVDLSARLEEACHWLAVGVSAVINLFNPSRLFISGRMFDADPHLLSRVIDRARLRTLRPAFADCQILRATGQKHQGAVAGIIQHLTSAIAPTLETKPLYYPTEVRDGFPVA